MTLSITTPYNGHNLLVKDDIVRPVVLPGTNRRPRHSITKLTRLHVAGIHNNAVVVLQRRRHEGAGLVDAEAARVAAAGRSALHDGQGTGGLVDGEADERVRDDAGARGGTAGDEGGDLEVVFAARRDDDELLVGLGGLLAWSWPLGRAWMGDTYRDLNLGGLGAGGDRIAGGAGGDVKELRGLEIVADVLDLVPRHSVGELVERVQVGAAGRLGEGDVAGTGASGRLDRGEDRGGRIVAADPKDVDGVGAEIRGNDELARRVEDRVVDVGGLLAVGTGSGGREGVVLGVEELQLLGVTDVVGGEGGGVADEVLVAGAFKVRGVEERTSGRRRGRHSSCQRESRRRGS